MLARPVPGLAVFLQVHFQASLKMALGPRCARKSTAATEHRPPRFTSRITSSGLRGRVAGDWLRVACEVIGKSSGLKIRFKQAFPGLARLAV
jgi:hypothetical protein